MHWCRVYRPSSLVQLPPRWVPSSAPSPSPTQCAAGGEQTPVPLPLFQGHSAQRKNYQPGEGRGFKVQHWLHVSQCKAFRLLDLVVTVLVSGFVIHYNAKYVSKLWGSFNVSSPWYYITLDSPWVASLSESFFAPLPDLSLFSSVVQSFLLPPPAPPPWLLPPASCNKETDCIVLQNITQVQYGAHMGCKLVHTRYLHTRKSHIIAQFHWCSYEHTHSQLLMRLGQLTLFCIDWLQLVTQLLHLCLLLSQSWPQALNQLTVLLLSKMQDEFIYIQDIKC